MELLGLAPASSDQLSCGKVGEVSSTCPFSSTESSLQSPHIWPTSFCCQIFQTAAFFGGLSGTIVVCDPPQTTGVHPPRVLQISLVSIPINHQRPVQCVPIADLQGQVCRFLSTHLLPGPSSLTPLWAGVWKGLGPAQ